MSDGNTLQDELFQALGGASNGIDERARTFLRSAVSRVQFTPEQENLMSMFLSLSKSAEEAEKDGGDDTDAPHASNVTMSERRLRQELRDLREANDTLAAALGACAYCWGGDDGCGTCGGAGRAGSKEPDPALFDALVAPAVRRVAAKRNREQARPSRARNKQPNKETADGPRVRSVRQ